METVSDFGNFDYAVGMYHNRCMLAAYDQKANIAMFIDPIQHTLLNIVCPRFEFVRWATEDDIKTVSVGQP